MLHNVHSRAITELTLCGLGALPEGAEAPEARTRLRWAGAASARCVLSLPFALGVGALVLALSCCLRPPGEGRSGLLLEQQATSIPSGRLPKLTVSPVCVAYLTCGMLTTHGQCPWC